MEIHEDAWMIEPLLSIEDRLGAFLSGPLHPQMIYTQGMTYGEIYALAQRLRSWIGKGVPDRETILLCSQDKSVVMASLLATMGTGRVLLMPNALSVDALEESAHATVCRYAILDAPLPLPKGMDAVVACEAPPGSPLIDTGRALDPDAVWVRLFTGGSTAAPKIWDKTLRNLMGEALYLSRSYDVGIRDHIVATVPAYHIYGLLYSVLMPFVASASVFGGMPYYPNEIVQAVQAQKATILISVPPHYRALGGHCLESEPLRLAFSSAGMLALEDGQVFTRNNGVAVVEIYGSTETGGVASRARARGETAFTPFDCATVKVEAEHIWVKSDFLSPGLADPASGFFMMGDRAETMRSGRFMLLGRSDGIIKVGGRRVDAETIRQTLLNQDGIADAVVFALPIPGGRENQLVAVVEGQGDLSALSEKIAAELEPYARPRRIRAVGKIPFTAAGKYDRSRLRALFEESF